MRYTVVGKQPIKYNYSSDAYLSKNGSARVKLADFNVGTECWKQLSLKEKKNIRVINVLRRTCSNVIYNDSRPMCVSGLNDKPFGWSRTDVKFGGVFFFYVWVSVVVY